MSGPADTRRASTRGDGSRHDGSSRLPLLRALAPVAVVVTALTVLFGVTAITLRELLIPSGSQPPNARALAGLPAATGSTVTVPAAEAQRVHDSLHSVGAWCRADPAGRVRSRLDRDVDVILTFTRRYPEATFPIDDETGRALTLLMTTRQALRTCAPAAAARVDRALPPQFQEGVSGPVPTMTGSRP